MSEKPISPLRQRMLEDMSVRRFTPDTQREYVRAVKRLAAFLGRSPDSATPEELRSFQLYLTGTGVRPPTINATVTALRFFFKVTLDRPQTTRRLIFVYEPRKLPRVLSPEEVLRLLKAAPGPKHFMGYDRRWQEAIGSEDAHGRALWALGQTVLDSPSPGMTGAAMTLFEPALPAVYGLSSPRSWAFALLGLDAYRRRFSGASDARRARTELAERLFKRLSDHATPDWPWPEDTITYANGVIPQALVVSGRELDRPDMVDADIKSLRWLMDIQTDARAYFAPIGNDGWFVRGGPPARFDQQPTEAQHMVDALLEVHQMTGEERWLEDARCCFEWFLGRNDLQQAVADDVSGGCRDGLRPDGVNQNEGAESTIAWLHATMKLHLATAAGLTEAPAATETRSSAQPVLSVVGQGRAPH